MQPAYGIQREDGSIILSSIRNSRGRVSDLLSMTKGRVGYDKSTWIVVPILIMEVSHSNTKKEKKNDNPRNHSRKKSTKKSAVLDRNDRSNHNGGRSDFGKL